jgi:NitT/TauT family transport system permease protein
MAIARAEGSLKLPASARRKNGLLRYPGASRLAAILALLGIWEITARFCVDREFLSPPSVVLTSLGDLARTPGVPEALLLALYELTIAFALSVVIGVGIGLVIGLSRFAHKSFMPIVLLLYGIPQITILPIFILMFGIDAPCKIAFGVSHGIFPVLIAVAAGVRNLKPVLLVSARSMGANGWQIFRYVIFPHMIPSFFAGMRLGMTAALLGVLLAELYSSTAGIGYFTSIFTHNSDSTKLFGLVSVLATMAVVLNEIVRWVEVRYSRWRT